MTESARDEQLDHEELLAKLGLEDKVSLLTGVDYWHLRAHPGIGLRQIRTSDGPAWVRGPRISPGTDTPDGGGR
jgi:beta-glucosidase